MKYANITHHTLVLFLLKEESLTYVAWVDNYLVDFLQKVNPMERQTLFHIKIDQSSRHLLHQHPNMK